MKLKIITILIICSAALTSLSCLFFNHGGNDEMLADSPRDLLILGSSGGSINLQTYADKFNNAAVGARVIISGSSLRFEIDYDIITDSSSLLHAAETFWTEFSDSGRYDSFMGDTVNDNIMVLSEFDSLYADYIESLFTLSYDSAVILRALDNVCCYASRYLDPLPISVSGVIVNCYNLIFMPPSFVCSSFGLSMDDSAISASMFVRLSVETIPANGLSELPAPVEITYNCGEYALAIPSDIVLFFGPSIITLPTPVMNDGFVGKHWVTTTGATFPFGYEYAAGVSENLTLVVESELFPVYFFVSHYADEYPTMNCYDGEEIVLPDPDMVDGFYFLGWKCGDKIYAAGDKVIVHSDMSFNLEYADCCVTFNSVVSVLAEPVAPIYVKSGTEITLPTPTLKSGYIGIDWSTVDTPNTHYAFGAKYTVTGDKYFLLYYKSNEINFDVRHVADELSPLHPTGDDNIVVLPDPDMLDGYYFMGWQIGDKIYNAGDTVVVDGNMTAVLQFASAKIVFTPLPSIYETIDIMYSSAGLDIVMPTPVMKLSTYVPIHWTTMDGSVSLDFGAIYRVTGDVVFKLNYANAITVSFDVLGAANVVDNIVVAQNGTIVLPVPTVKNGYVGICWIDTATGIKYDFGASVVVKNAMTFSLDTMPEYKIITVRDNLGINSIDYSVKYQTYGDYVKSLFPDAVGGGEDTAKMGYWFFGGYEFLDTVGKTIMKNGIDYTFVGRYKTNAQVVGGFADRVILNLFDKYSEHPDDYYYIVHYFPIDVNLTVTSNMADSDYIIKWDSRYSVIGDTITFEFDIAAYCRKLNVKFKPYSYYFVTNMDYRKIDNWVYSFVVTDYENIDNSKYTVYMHAEYDDFSLWVNDIIGGQDPTHGTGGKVENFFGNVFTGIGGFFKNIFGMGDENPFMVVLRWLFIIIIVVAVVWAISKLVGIFK